jgi:hypothetical protein
MKRGDLVAFRPLSVGDATQGELVVTRYIMLLDYPPEFPREPAIRVLRNSSSLAIVTEVSGKYVKVITATGESGWVHESDLQSPKQAM